MKSIKIDYSVSKLRVCNDTLWVGGSVNGVFLYNFDLEQIKHIEHPQFKCVTSVVKTPTGVIVFDFHAGVHQLNHQGDYTNLICSGRFSDGTLTSHNKIYALNCIQGKIYTFVRNQNRWVKDIKFK